MPGRGRIRHKAATITSHLRADPRPFAWADDHLHRRTPPPPVRQLELAHLLIRSQPRIGLTAEPITKLLSFTATHQPIDPAVS